MHCTAFGSVTVSHSPGAGRHPGRRAVGSRPWLQSPAISLEEGVHLNRPWREATAPKRPAPHGEVAVW